MREAGLSPVKLIWSPRTIAVGLLVVFLVAYPWIFPGPFQRRLLVLVFLYAMLGQAWNILGGYAGQVSLGHAAFFGVGAYTSTLLFLRFGVTPWIGLAAGGAVAVGLSQLIGYPSFRLKGHYFVIATIVLAAIVKTVFLNWEGAGGARGLTIPPMPESFLAFQFHQTKLPYYYISLGLLALVQLATYRLERSRAGYYFRAIKEDPDAARSLGVDITAYKLRAIAMSAFFTGVGGAFYAQFVLYIFPDSVLAFMLSVLVMLVAVVGGIGTLWGPVLGAALLIPLSEFTRIALGGAGSAVDLVVYGLLIMLVAAFQPRGLWALWERLSAWGRTRWPS